MVDGYMVDAARLDRLGIGWQLDLFSRPFGESHRPRPVALEAGPSAKDRTTTDEAARPSATAWYTDCVRAGSSHVRLIGRRAVTLRTDAIAGQAAPPGHRNHRRRSRSQADQGSPTPYPRNEFLLARTLGRKSNRKRSCRQ